MQAFQTYSPSEISLHTTKKDCWLSIHGKVYDVTTFLEDHPGGEDVILHVSASGDATQAFDDVGHSSTATSMMESYVIGTVEGYASGIKPTSRHRLPKQEQPPPSYSFTDYLLPLLVLGIAFAAWYYLTFYSKATA
ncbi:Cytochrome b5 [Musa troglodytarum]|uniref:Cytochrome b5 n=1 Tax=Musa troglodytarum TaxID=320322 RepID=A0A9E7K999_9LILI|nr:Cytochrome b5 [Musa troglodytarum]